MRFQCLCMGLFHVFLMHFCIVWFFSFSHCCFGSLSEKWKYLIWNISIRFWEELATSSRENHVNWSGWVEVTVQAPGVCKEQGILYFGLLWRMLFATNPRVFVDSWLIFWFYSAFFFVLWGLQQLKQHRLTTRQFQLSPVFEMATLLNVCDLFLEHHFSCQFPWESKNNMRSKECK